MTDTPKPALSYTAITNAEDLARLFHAYYEELAPKFQYETREKSRTEWDNVPDNNRKLMIATANKVLKHFPPRPEGGLDAAVKKRCGICIYYEPFLSQDIGRCTNIAKYPTEGLSETEKRLSHNTREPHDYCDSWEPLWEFCHPENSSLDKAVEEIFAKIFDTPFMRGCVTSKQAIQDILQSHCTILDENRPKIVCLCGSTRFMDAFFQTGWDETLKGHIVLSVGVCKHVDAEGGHGGEALGQDIADALDELHFRKIDLADEVIVLRIDGYIGSSTSKEIAYAKSIAKPITYIDYGKAAFDALGERNRKT